MSDTTSKWTVLWKYLAGGPQGETFYRSREMALDAACNPSRYETAVRIKGPNGEVVEQEAIEQLCKGRPRRP
jgi:hypothetical protein